jgi:hypothetical protein
VNGIHCSLSKTSADIECSRLNADRNHVYARAKIECYHFYVDTTASTYCLQTLLSPPDLAAPSRPRYLLPSLPLPEPSTSREPSNGFRACYHFQSLLPPPPELVAASKAYRYLLSLLPPPGHTTGTHLESTRLDGARLDGRHLDDRHLDSTPLDGSYLRQTP